MLQRPAPAPVEPQPCAAQAGGDIVVCGRRRDPDRYRLKPLTGQAPVALPRAEIGLAEGVRAGAEVEQAAVGGFASRRAMVRLKIGF